MLTSPAFWALDPKPWTLASLQRDLRDLRGAVEAEWQSHGADPTIHVKLHLVEVEESGDVPLSHRRKHQWPNPRQPNLSSVRVAGQHQVDERKTWMAPHVIGEIRLVRQQDNGSARIRRDRLGQIRHARSRVVDPA